MANKLLSLLMCELSTNISSHEDNELRKIS
jgi:hypothetical protein